MKKLGIVLVHYHSPALLAPAIAALRTDAAAAGITTEIVVVDNGSTAAEQAELLALARQQELRLHVSGRNSGYAGGVNAGAALLPAADMLLLMNPDVLVLPGCLAALWEKVAAGAAACGPLFYWDEPGGFALPPTEACGFFEELLRVAAGRHGGALLKLARRRWRAHARRYFLAEQAFAGYDLSGALLMVSAEAFRQLGGFDESYALYFEETDFLQRLRQAGLPACFEPRARAIHLYAQSTPRDGRVAALYGASQKLFRHRFYGNRRAAWLAALAAGGAASAAPELAAATPLSASGSWPLDPRAAWLEISPSPLRYPAAARRLPAAAGRLEPILSPPLLERMAPGVYWLQTVAADGRELALGRLEVPAQTRSPSPMV